MSREPEPTPLPKRTLSSPRGGHFELVGRVGPITPAPAPEIPAEATEDLLVVKEGKIFACSRLDGEIHPGLSTGEGLYANDTRYLSELSMQLDGQGPVLLSTSAQQGFMASINLTNPTLAGRDGREVPQMSLNVRRTRLVADRFHEQIAIRNHGRERAETTLTVSFGADFADMFEVRGVRHRNSRGHALMPKAFGRVVRFAYVGEDDLFRETYIELAPRPAALHAEGTRVLASWEVSLAPGEARTVELAVEPSLQEESRLKLGFDTALARSQRSLETFKSACTEIRSEQRSFNRLIDASLRDIKALITPINGRNLPVAGIPWFVAPFGRDSLITCYETLPLNPGLARDTLLFLAERQATELDPSRDAEPGKILHELRFGELARAGYVAHTPYYGTVDATPLFIMLAASYFRWTNDIATLATLRPHLDAALHWIDNYGDTDGDGFVEYQMQSPGGLKNQGWKDSHDSIVNADGSLAEEPIALVEVQGYVYLARQRIAEVYEALDDAGTASRLRTQALALRKSFNEAFWMDAEGSFALALDRRKRQVGSITSNPGHCLYCGIVDTDKAPKLAERLMAPDMFSGWGVRTLSSQSPAFNPMSYHNGSVWPHDNALIAAGLKRYNLEKYTFAIATALFEAALEARDLRLPELYCGFERQNGASYVQYPVACRPQAWAAAVPFMLLQSMLGMSAQAPEGVLAIHQPSLPDWLTRIEMRDLRVGDGLVSLEFNRTKDSTSVSVLARKGSISVSLQP